MIIYKVYCDFTPSDVKCEEWVPEAKEEVAVPTSAASERSQTAVLRHHPGHQYQMCLLLHQGTVYMEQSNCYSITDWRSRCSNFSCGWTLTNCCTSSPSWPPVSDVSTSSPRYSIHRVIVLLAAAAERSQTAVLCHHPGHQYQMHLLLHQGKD